MFKFVKYSKYLKLKRENKNLNNILINKKNELKYQNKEN
jgi:hypothetical protein